MNFGRCRFCAVSAPHGELVHYAVRHWAHPVCLYKRKGLETINALHTWQIRHLPVIAMMEAGVAIEQIRAWAARIEADDCLRESADMSSDLRAAGPPCAPRARPLTRLVHAPMPMLAGPHAIGVPRSRS